MKNLTLFLCFSPVWFWSQNAEETLIKATLNQLFTGMKNADSVLIKNSFAKNAVLQTITKNGARDEKLKDFAESISRLNKNDADERIIFENILVDGNLASVWTPYEFYYKGRFSHCGVNSFQLVKTNGEWKIQYLIDTRRKDNCKKPE